MEWINVKDNLPELDKKVICLNQFGEMHICSLEKRWADESPIWWVRESVITFYPSHWMPLPELPTSTSP